LREPEKGERLRSTLRRKVKSGKEREPGRGERLRSITLRRVKSGKERGLVRVGSILTEERSKP